MIESLPFPSALQALGLVGVVLIEAILLYVGYGYVEQLFAPSLLKKIENI